MCVMCDVAPVYVTNQSHYTSGSTQAVSLHWLYFGTRPQPTLQHNTRPEEQRKIQVNLNHRVAPGPRTYRSLSFALPSLNINMFDIGSYITLTYCLGPYETRR